MTTRNQSRAFLALIVALLAGGIYAFLVVAEAVQRANLDRESKHLTEKQMWPEIRPCQDELWECIRQPMVRNDI